VLGVADLVTAVTLGATSSPGPLQLFHNGPSAAIMANLPWVLIPCFLVPLFLVVHLCIFYRLQTLAPREQSEHVRAVRMAAPSS
jgi:Na+/pantothenate symporter